LASPNVFAAAGAAGACVAGAAAGAQPNIVAINTTARMILNNFAVFIFHSPYEISVEMDVGSFLILRLFVWDLVHLLTDGPEHWSKGPGKKTPIHKIKWILGMRISPV
jgi:hypothetical protein